MTRMVKQKKIKYFNRSMLSDGILLFSLSFISLGIEERTLILFGHEIYSIPDWPYMVVGIVSAMVSILFLIATFNEHLAHGINNVIAGSFSNYYWSVFWFAYTASWLKGIAIVPQGKLIFYLVAYLGTIWFVIITVIWVKSIIKNALWLKEYSLKIGKK